MFTPDLRVPVLNVQTGISATRGLTRCVLGILFVSNMASLYQYPVPVPPLSASKLISSVEITRAN